MMNATLLKISSMATNFLSVAISILERIENSRAANIQQRKLIPRNTTNKETDAAQKEEVLLNSQPDEKRFSWIIGGKFHEQFRQSRSTIILCPKNCLWSTFTQHGNRITVPSQQESCKLCHSTCFYNFYKRRTQWCDYYWSQWFPSVGQA
uniref:Uncharacterized protein n=1 Tax=Romanomermis culicivorax TaxID=13658 RepID=A0A915JSP4_ROMCU